MPPFVAAKPSPATRAEPSSAKAKAEPSSGVVTADYVIGADDTLQITVWKETGISGSFLVRPDGMISLVLVGELRAAGRTPLQLSQQIQEALKKYVQDPNVTVIVTAATSHRVFVVGEVQHVGPLYLTADMTPLEAIATAGGLSPFANAKHIYILRKSRGKTQRIPFNYKNALKGNDQGILLVSGDTIVVP